jgi:hypothetical protein
MNTQQPQAESTAEALRLADSLESSFKNNSRNVDDIIQAIEELRRQFDEIKRLESVNVELLGALKNIAEYTYGPWTNGVKTRVAACSAIAKAEGMDKSTGEKK